MERRFIKSGIPGLDEVLGEGFLANSIVTIGGPSGSGKSTFALQFLYNGAYESDEVGVYICIEENRQDFMFHISGYEWDIQKAEAERKLVFLDYPVHEVDQVLNSSSAVAELISSVGAKRVVIDSVMPIALYFHSDDERKKGFLKLIENIRKWNATTLIISEDTTPEAAWEIPTSIYGIEKFTDGWIDLSYRYDEKKAERVRYIEVLKMKGVAHSMKPHQATIGSKGFTLLKDTAGQHPPLTKVATAKPPPQATLPFPRFVSETPIEPERQMRRITMPPPPEAKPPAPASKPPVQPPKAAPARPPALPPKTAPAKPMQPAKPVQRSAVKLAQQNPAKPAAKKTPQAAPKRSERDASADRLALIAKLAAAKSRILKKSK